MVEDTTFSVYPNPVSDVLNISGNETLVKAQVYNQLGQLVLTSEKSDLSGNTIDMAQLNTGIYIVKLFGESNSQSITISKK
ncbi:T9SS type A sorting domain-containing protein [Neptunitalea chrysea]|uniref:T9SS type A sorting domain-containing protein n=1 Tax=Neptunitalea chrysea TaxID=1647581 RepID=UPI0028527572|nr:T9SS type A sorting domain-containing protein [Neptunitalea chrysea]